MFVGCWLSGTAENIHMTKVFILPIEPGMFNWTLQGMGQILQETHVDLYKVVLNIPPFYLSSLLPALLGEVL
jgi:hypothetical protein